MFRKILAIVIVISLLMSLVMIPTVSAVGAGSTYTVLEDYEKMFSEFAKGGVNEAIPCPPVHVFNRGALIWNPTGSSAVGPAEDFGIIGTEGCSGMSWLVAKGSINNETGITTDTSIRLTMYAWDATASATLRLGYGELYGEIPQIIKDTQAIVIRLGVKNATSTTNISFGMYQDGVNGELSTYYGKKTNLDCLSAYLIDATTKKSTKVNLGAKSGYFVPTEFDGWVVLPLSYFNLDSNFDMEKVTALRVNTSNGGTQTNLYIDEIGVTSDIDDFIKDKCDIDITMVNFAKTFPTFLPGGLYGTGEPYNGTGITSTNLVANTALVSWWTSGEVPANISTQAIGGKRVVSTNLNTNDAAVVAHTYGTMPMAVKMVSATTDSDASGVIALKNAGGVTATTSFTDASKFVNSEAVAIRMATWTHPGATGINPLYPGVYFDFYEQKTGETDGRSLGEKFVRKTAPNLVGTTVYLIDATTGAVTEKALGTTSTDANTKELASCFVPNNFDGWVIVPLSYFTYQTTAPYLDTAGNQTLDENNLAGITVGEKYSRADSYFYVGEVAMTVDTEGFIREKGKLNMTIIDYATARPDFMPGGTYGTGPPNYGTGIIPTNVVTNNLLLSWWSAPTNPSTQYIVNKYVASSNLDTSSGSIVANTYGGMPMALKLAYSTTGSDASAVIPLKNGGGVTAANPIPSRYSNSEAITIRMATTTQTSGSEPGVYFDLFEQLTGSSDAQNLGEKFVRKTAANLIGTTVYLIDATTLAVTEKALGMQGGTAAEQESSSCFVPNNFNGWVVLPLSYFTYQSAGSLDTAGNQTLDVTNLVGMTVGEKTSRTDNNLYIGEVGLAQSAINFVKSKINSQDKMYNFTTTTIENIPEKYFDCYQNVGTKIIANISLNSVLQYKWTFEGRNIQLPMNFNPAIEIKNAADSGINKAAYNTIDAMYLQLAHTGEMPGKTSLTVKVPNFEENAPLFLYSYNTDGGVLVKISDDLVVDDGYTTFEIYSAGNYVISDEEFKLADSYRNIPVVDFEFSPFTDYDNVVETHIYNNNVLIRNNTVGATDEIVEGLVGGYTGLNTVNSTRIFAYGDLDTAIQFWPMNSAPCSATFNLTNTLDNNELNMQFLQNSGMLVVKLATRDIAGDRGFYFDLYEKNSTGGLGEMFTRKSAANLAGQIAYLIDADTKVITQIDLGTVSNIIPNGFDGTIMLPLTYFTYGSGNNGPTDNQILDLTNLLALRIGAQTPNTSFTYAIDSIGFAASGYNLKTSDYIKDKNMWSTPYLESENNRFGIDMATFYFDEASPEHQITDNSITHYGMGSLNLLTPEPFAGEWDTSYLTKRGTYDGRGELVLPDPYPTASSTRQETLRRLYEFISGNYLIDDLTHTNPWTSMTGIYPWQHYAGEMGFDRIGVELGEAISSYQTKIAYTRGAGRQYGKTWFVDFSSWHQGYMLDYKSPSYWAEGGINNGHSLSLLNRTFMMSYMAGMNFFISEAGSFLSFNQTQNSAGFYDLTPYGETIQKCNAFATKNPDVGTSYTPFGLVLDYYHGASGGDNGIRNDADKAFGLFDYNAGDDMSYNIFNTFFPDSLQVVGFNETTTMVNSPYGDTCDVLLQDASQEVLNNYPSLILSGNINFSKEEAQRYKVYVNQGGILVINTAYLPYFPEYAVLYDGSNNQEITVGNGKVVFYGPDYDITQLPSILSDLRNEFIPFVISEDIEYMMNVKDGSLLLTLINNNGVTKEPSLPVVIDNNQTINLNATYNGGKTILSVRELVANSEVTVSNGLVNVTLLPGEVKVFEFKFDVPSKPVTSISLNTSSISIGKGVTNQLIATISPSNAENKSVTWTSSNTAIATVSSTGLVTAIAVGTATITAKALDGGFTSTCAVTVTRYDQNRYYKIAYSPNTSLVMDATTTGLGGVIKHVTYSGADSQQWRIIDVGGNAFKILNKATGYALNVYGGANSTGKNIIQSTYASSNRMHWTITDYTSYVRINSKLGTNTYIRGTGTSGATLYTAASSTSLTTQRWVITLLE